MRSIWSGTEQGNSGSLACAPERKRSPLSCKKGVCISRWQREQGTGETEDRPACSRIYFTVAGVYSQ